MQVAEVLGDQAFLRVDPEQDFQGVQVPGPSCPWNLLSMASAGFPGISRGAGS